VKDSEFQKAQTSKKTQIQMSQILSEVKLPGFWGLKFSVTTLNNIYLTNYEEFFAEILRVAEQRSSLQHSTVWLDCQSIFSNWLSLEFHHMPHF